MKLFNLISVAVFTFASFVVVPLFAHARSHWWTPRHRWQDLEEVGFDVSLLHHKAFTLQDIYDKNFKTMGVPLMFGWSGGYDRGRFWIIDDITRTMIIREGIVLTKFPSPYPPPLQPNMSGTRRPMVLK